MLSPPQRATEPGLRASAPGNRDTEGIFGMMPDAGLPRRPQSPNGAILTRSTHQRATSAQEDTVKFSTITRGDSQVITAAIHDGHDLRPEVASIMKLDDAGRLREEDPWTGEIAKISDTRIIGHRSRFEVDLNRAEEEAVYRRPEDAWGLDVWEREPSDEIVEDSLALYDQFNREVFELLDESVEQFGKVILFDLHSYNHRRNGPNADPADPLENPEINVGTGHINHAIFRPVIDTFIETLSSQPFQGRTLDVRENIKFRGGNFARRIHQRYPDTVCVLAVEFKKVFMDEWTGVVDEGVLGELVEAMGVVKLVVGGV